MFKQITILGGRDKNGSPEAIERLEVQTGEVLAVVGPTGSGKTQLISDIEQYADGETPTHRLVLINDLPVNDNNKNGVSRHLVAEVSQKMNFIIDIPVRAFLLKHALVRSIANPEEIIEQVLAITNKLAGEPVSFEDNLTMLSGGQARALMVADVALISNSPVVLIDEIENAGIDRLKALDILTGQGKAVLVVTHDPTLTLMASRRVIMKNGGMNKLHRTTPEEKKIMKRLIALEKNTSYLRDCIRSGESIKEGRNKKEKGSDAKHLFTHPT